KDADPTFLCLVDPAWMRRAKPVDSQTRFGMTPVLDHARLHFHDGKGHFMDTQHVPAAAIRLANQRCDSTRECAEAHDNSCLNIMRQVRWAFYRSTAVDRAGQGAANCRRAHEIAIWPSLTKPGQTYL